MAVAPGHMSASSEGRADPSAVWIEAGITFATGLRAILRQDPDTILVGEIRDVETARIAVQAALTGHFVMSSLHAIDATAAMNRFLDMGIEPFLLASSLTGVVGQRLVRRNCPRCVVDYTPTVEEMADRKSTRLNSSHIPLSRMPSSA